MGDSARILAFSGSVRTGSFHRKLINIAVDGAREAGADVNLIDLRDFPMPLYDGDIEENEGLPENALKMRALFGEHDGLLIASPEYNSSITPLLKNTIDWVSRPTADEPMLKYISGKTAGLVSGAPGSLGGLRSITMVRQILTNIRVTVITPQATIGGIRDAFNEDDTLKDDSQRDAVQAVGAELARVTALLKG